MMVVGATALALAIARHVLEYWGPGEFLAVGPVVLLATNVLAWFQPARWQRFWVGFGLCGWAYLTFSLGSPLAEYLPTTWLLDALHDRLAASWPPPAPDDFPQGILSGQAHAEAFRRAGQSLLSLLFGLLGGLVALVLFPIRFDEPPGPPDGSLLGPGWRERTDLRGR
jgi:hypothetical protein